MKVYNVVAYLHGDINQHSYPVGVFGTQMIAEMVAKEESLERGGKYGIKVYEMSFGETYYSFDPIVVYETESK
jgi:hypothetical protein